MPLGFWHRIIANKEPVFIACCSTQAIFVGDAAPSGGWWLGLLQQGSMGIALREREREISEEKIIVKWNV